jgi:hypothetical protein
MRSPLPIIAIAVLAIVLATSNDSGGKLFAPKPTCRVGRVTHNYFVDIPEAYRERNYTGNSCVWSSAISMLRGMGDHTNANWIRRHCAGPATVKTLANVFKRLGIPYLYTINGDTKLLKLALKHNRSCVIGYWDNHAQLYVGAKNDQSIILNNYRNGTKLYGNTWQSFLAEWRAQGGWAIVAFPTHIVPPPEVPFYGG